MGEWGSGEIVPEGAADAVFAVLADLHAVLVAQYPDVFAKAEAIMAEPGWLPRWDRPRGPTGGGVV